MHKPTFSQQNPIYPSESLQNANPIPINKNCAALSDILLVKKIYICNKLCGIKKVQNGKIIAYITYITIKLLE